MLTDTRSAAPLRPVRRWLLVLVFVSDVVLVALSAVGDEVSGASDGALSSTE